MKTAALLWSLVLIAGATCAGCVRPLEARTFVFEVPGQRGFDHPADVPADAIALALVGRVPAADIPPLARAIASRFRSLRPSQVVYYRHAHGGAYLIGVRGRQLVVIPHGLRAAKSAAPAAYDLDALAAARRSGPRKRAERGEPTATGGEGAMLEVDVAFAATQFVFVNGTFTGTVEPGQMRSFPVAPGHAVVVAADAADGARNAVRAEFDFQPGQLEHWSILPEF